VLAAAFGVKFCAMANPVTTFDSNPKIKQEFYVSRQASQTSHPAVGRHLQAIYLTALEALQDENEHEQTKTAVKEFLEGDGPKLQKRLQEWAGTKARYV